MIILSTLSLLISNAVSLRRDMSILYNRIVIIALLYAILQNLICFSIISNSGIGLHGGLFHVTNITQVFHIFLYFISILILQLTSFYPRKVWVSEHSSLKDFLMNKFIYYRTKIINKMGEHLKIIEYPKGGVKVSLTNRKNTQFTNTNLITNSIQLRIGSLNNLNINTNKRFFSQALLPTNISKFTESLINSDLSLNPWFLTGFTDGDGSFSILTSKDIRGKLLCKVQPVFTFGLHKKDLPLLLMIQKYFGGVGNIHTRKADGTVYYNTSSVKDIIKYVIPHFDSYPLVSQKKADFLLFREIVILMSKKEHLSNSGLTKIISLKASLNLGLKGWVADLFANVEPAIRPEIKVLRVEDLNPYWVSGFICAEGCFNIVLSKNDKLKAGYRASIWFILTQNNRDSELMYKIRDLFKSGSIKCSDRDNTVELRITDFQYLKNILVPFLDKYPLIGAKALEYVDFKTVLELMDNKIHLTKEGYDQIKMIKDGMNTKRK